MLPPSVNPLASVEADSMKNLSVIKTPVEVGVTVIDKNRQWLGEHATEIEQYAAWARAREPYAQRVRRWRQSLEGKPTEADGAV